MSLLLTTPTVFYTRHVCLRIAAVHWHVRLGSIKREKLSYNAASPDSHQTNRAVLSFGAASVVFLGLFLRCNPSRELYFWTLMLMILHCLSITILCSSCIWGWVSQLSPHISFSNLNADVLPSLNYKCFHWSKKFNIIWRQLSLWVFFM